MATRPIVTVLRPAFLLALRVAKRARIAEAARDAARLQHLIGVQSAHARAAQLSPFAVKPGTRGLSR